MDKSCVNKETNFRPRKIPRYLPGSVKKEVLRRDLKEYNAHLYKVFYAEPKVDDIPPKFHFDKYLGLVNMEKEVVAMNRVEQQNKDLLRRINIINRSHGIVDTFNKFANANSSKWFKKVREIEKINKENKKFYNKLKKTQSVYPKAEHDKHWKNVLFKLGYSSKFPLVIFEKKTKDQILHECPSISKNIDVNEGTYRPRCFLEFKLETGLALGKMIIELYQDQVPETVEHFMKLCDGEDDMSLTNCPVTKIFPEKYALMGDTTNFNGTGRIIKPENFFLQHTRPGVLSMVPTKQNEIQCQFCITFEKMPEFNDKYVVFGKIIKGAETLYKVKDFGSKFGRPISKMIISNSGVVN